MAKIIDMLENLKRSGLLRDGFILTPEERKVVEEAFRAGDRSKISKDEKVSRFSVIQAENGDLFAIYNPNVDQAPMAGPSSSSAAASSSSVGSSSAAPGKFTYDSGAYGVIKLAQNLRTGHFSAVKIQVEPPPTHLPNVSLEAIETEKAFLDKQKLLHGYQSIARSGKGKKHYTFKEILPGIQLYVPPPPMYSKVAKPAQPSFASEFMKDISYGDYLKMCRNILLKLQELNEQNIIHRDLHGGNILIDKDNDYAAHFIDWGSAVEADENGAWRGFPAGTYSRYEGDIQTFYNSVDLFYLNESLQSASHRSKDPRIQQFFIFRGAALGDLRLEGTDMKHFDIKPFIDRVESLIKEEGLRPRL